MNNFILEKLRSITLPLSKPINLLNQLPRACLPHRGDHYSHSQSTWHDHSQCRVASRDNKERKRKLTFFISVIFIIELTLDTFYSHRATAWTMKIIVEWHENGSRYYSDLLNKLTLLTSAARTNEWNVTLFAKFKFMAGLMGERARHIN